MTSLEYSCWCLLNLPHFRQFYEGLNPEDKPDGDNNMIHQTFIKIAKQKNRKINETVICLLNIYFNETLNDPMGIICYIISKLHDALKYGIKSEIKGISETRIGKDTIKLMTETATWYHYGYSEISQLFDFQYVSILECNQCDYRQLNSTIDSVSILPVPKSDTKVTLDDCLKKLCGVERLDNFSCEKCKNMDSVNSIKFNPSPTNKHLIFCLKKVRDGMFINSLVEYPEELDLSKYCYPPQSNVIYTLTSIYCYHIDKQRQYVILKKDGKWIKLFIHNRINNKIIGSVAEMVTGDAYMLFYTRKEIADKL
jgi:hypothetical protein